MILGRLHFGRDLSSTQLAKKWRRLGFPISDLEVVPIAGAVALNVHAVKDYVDQSAIRLCYGVSVNRIIGVAIRIIW